MSDDLEDLKRMFRAEAPITPRTEAQEDAIAAAMQRFAQENSRARQGSADGSRLKRWVWALKRIPKGFSMPSLRMNRALLAGASLTVLAIAIVNSGMLRKQIPEPDKLALTAPPRQTGEGAGAENEAAAGRAEAPRSAMKDEATIAAAPPAAPVASAQPSPPPGARAAAEPAFAPRAAKQRASSDSLYAREPAGRIAAGPMAQDDDRVASYYQDQGRDRFSDVKANPVKLARAEPVSTFSIDVDTSSYSFVRAALNRNTLPQKDAVRVEEMINYFPYDYPGPADRTQPFKATVTVFPTPWNPGTKLLHIGIRGFALNGREKPRANLVFLLDTSGSMDEPSKLPLLVNSMKLLTDSLDPQDTISIVTYAGNAGTVLEPTKVKDKAKIIAALDNLRAGGSTAGAEGIRQAYRLAEQSFDKTGVNRVILATDGDFNVGITDPEELKSFVERERASGVYLSVLGFGRGNYNDAMMQTLAQNGNGNAAYIDTLNEARKVLVDEATATLFPIAKDVKIQVEFNPDAVSEYRLIGYETRLLDREDFNNDKVDAGDIGAGHTVTAIYEITPRGSKARLNDDLRYAPATAPSPSTGEYAFVKIRYKLPDSDTSKLITTPVTSANEITDPQSVPREQRFATAVAAFGQILTGGRYTKAFTYDDVIALAQGAKGPDPFGYRAEFVNLVRLAKTAPALEPLQP